MKVRMPLTFMLGFLATCTVMAAFEPTGDKARAKIDEWIDTAKKIAAEPSLVKAVAAQNHQLAVEYADMSQVKWAALADLDPLVTALSKNAAAKTLKAHKVAGLAELFVSDNQGRKVAFLSKPTNWSHEGKAKHEQPMAGKVWEGRVEYDQSTRRVQVQIAVPVLQEGKPIGSLVVGVEWEWLEKM
ncbi:MAG: hypothetical protein QM715_14480 [Nibricoccus sp.]